jgi:hypothetical protein
MPGKGEIVSRRLSTVDYFLSAASLGNFGRPAFIFRPLAHNLNDFPDIGTFTFFATGVENISVATISGAVLGIGFAF